MLEVHEPRVVLLPQQFDVVGGAISLLGHDDLGLALDPFAVFIVALVILLAVHEHHHVGILLDGARLPEVVEPGPVVARGLRLTVELGQAEHRDIELARHHLQPAGDPGHLLLSWVPRIVGLDQLQVVDHDQRQLLLPLEAAGHRRDLRERAAGSVVDVERRGADLRRFLHQPAAVLLGDGPIAEPVPVDLRRGAQQPVGEFEAGHLEADEEHRPPQTDRHMLGDVHREGGLSHAGSGGEDDQLGVVQAPAERVEVGEARLHAADGVLVLHAGVHPHHHVLEHRRDRLGVGRAPPLEDREDLLLGPGQQLPRLVRLVVGLAQDVGAGVDQVAQDRLVANDLGIVGGVGRVRHRLEHVGQ